MSETVMYVIYIAAMLAGAGLFLAWAQDRRGVPAASYLVAIFIPLWSAAAYLAMALGQGSIEVAGQTVYFARYLDWIVTTPLLLLALSFTAMYKTSKDKTLIAGLMGADAFMIITGLIADLSEPPVSYLWYGLGMVALAVVFYGVWFPLRRQAQANPDPRIAGIYDRLALFLSIFWIGYPLTWLIGPSGINLVSREVDVALFIFLPIISKVGFSLYDLSMLRRLESSEARADFAPAR